MELTKSYSNLIEIARSKHITVGGGGNGHSVSQKLQALASDLGSLKAGVRDVIDIHTKATGRPQDSMEDAGGESQGILRELMSDLARYYRHASV